MNLGIVIGVEKYESDSFNNLAACKNDAKAIRDVISDVKEFKEILYLNGDESGVDLKRKIADFVEKYKDEDIDELVFYFSGHGERYSDDFIYLPSDFDRKKRETTGLRNSELDVWIKAISPKLCVKIVDACFSGTQYIKSESGAEIEFEKSVKKSGLNDIYFWFSSRENEVSYAGAEYSKFTESILTALLEKNGDVRYREIMDAVADDFEGKGNSRPIFITQSSNIEKFGHVTARTHSLIYKAFGFSEGSEDEAGRMEAPAIEKVVEPKLSIVDLAIKKSKEICFGEADLVNFIRDFNTAISTWSIEILKLYDVSIDDSIQNYQIPNRAKLGEWLDKNREKNLFLTPTYDERSFEVEEYKALPAKPSQTIRKNFSSFAALARRSFFEDESIEYKLEKVIKKEHFVNGFEYDHNMEKRILKISFNPKIEIVDPVSIYLVPVYSNKEMIISFSYEFLRRSNWMSYSSPLCLKWNFIKSNVNLKNTALSSANQIKKEIEEWLVETIEKNIN